MSNGPSVPGQLPTGVVRVATAPQRVAIVWASRTVDTVIDVLTDSGYLPVRLAVSDTEGFVSSSGAPPVMLIDSAALDDRAVAVVGALRRGRQIRVCVLAGSDAAAAGLLVALRAGFTEVVDPDDHDALVGALAPTAAEGAERVLAVGAHPDDVEIGCGATLLRHSLLGHPVTVLTLSGGAVGGPAQARRAEAAAAAMAMSAQLLMADLPDTRLGEAGEMTTIIEQVIAAVRPTTVYVHSAADSHQDHRAVHEKALIAARRVQQVFCYQSPSSRNGFAPTKFVPVEDTVDAKVAVLKQYRSQSTRHYLDPELVVATARYWARQLPHTRYAEPFEVIRATEPAPQS